MKKILLVATTRLCMDGLTEILLCCAKAAQGRQIGIALGEGYTPELEAKLQQAALLHPLPSRKRSLPSYIMALRRLIADEQYDTVYIHGNSATMAFDLLAAYWGGAKTRITHVHNCAKQPLLKQLTLGTLLNWLVTCPVACSETAGKQLYRKPFRVLKNGVDCSRFAFSTKIRETMRKELKLEDAFVVGHIGRFSLQKNQERLICIFAELLNKHPNTVLLLCGEGEDKDSCKKKAKELAIDDKVLFLGNVKDPQNYYQAMDVFVLPSLFEGLPLVGVEAQASGLPCVFSNAITKETQILPSCTFLPLNAGNDIWAETILNCKPSDRAEAHNLVEEAGFTSETLNEQIADLLGYKNAYIGSNDNL